MWPTLIDVGGHTHVGGATGARLRAQGQQTLRWRAPSPRTVRAQPLRRRAPTPPDGAVPPAGAGDAAEAGRPAVGALGAAAFGAAVAAGAGAGVAVDPAAGVSGAAETSAAGASMALSAAVLSAAAASELSGAAAGAAAAVADRSALSSSSATFCESLPPHAVTPPMSNRAPKAAVLRATIPTSPCLPTRADAAQKPQLPLSSCTSARPWTTRVAGHAQYMVAYRKYAIQYAIHRLSVTLRVDSVG